MIPIAFDVKITGDLSQRNLNRYLKLSLKAMLYEWFFKYFPLHFKRVAYRKYPGVYRRRGHRKRGSGPNVQSGAMKQQLEASFRVAGTPKMMTGTMSGPSYLGMNHPRGPNKIAEISEVSRTEQKHLARVFEKTFVDLVNNDTTEKRVRIKG